ncbi:MAG TPA: MBL fold metallo-hydrolase [Leptospiraceae bacterium]|nr:MBL fold metallo-hydrolase [Leptospiraceae bacterium]HMW05128.1 MBL fold metallo-hydrolase [Leptospiraceae bacterium]HMX31382.1 MBL fold metallo-hydrolase [Leptospiraceae bacterium]HMY31575.1 MBL fold metallo-hydrolase [Leptospiraceae bacterium]HMZ66685.1 MBL fold metallo-hydrolase [Leptospiraceae bacterium]
MGFHIETFPVYPLGCNCSIVSCDESKEAIVIDPGGSEDQIFRYLNSKNLRVTQIIHTHAHFDHCLGTKTIADANENCKIGLHKDDLKLYQNIHMQCQMFGIHYSGDIRELDFYLEDNQILSIGKSTNLEVLHTPGHSPGSVCFLLRSSDKHIVFSGDTLFAGSIGRTDLWGGDYDLILKSIQNRLFTLEDETLVIPGHGEGSVIYKEKLYNPYLN